MTKYFEFWKDFLEIVASRDVTLEKKQTKTLNLIKLTEELKFLYKIKIATNKHKVKANKEKKLTNSNFNKMETLKTASWIIIPYTTTRFALLFSSILILG